MKSLVTNKQHRERARNALNNQWGMMAWIIFLGLLIRIIVGSIVGGFFSNSPEGTGATFANFLLNNLLFFAITYGTYYAALRVLRGEKAKPDMLMSVFQGDYYAPMLIINFLQYIIEHVISLIMLLPVFITYGASLYFGLMFNTVSPEQLQSTLAGDISLALTVIVFTVLVFFISMFVSGIFQFAVWLKFDEGNITVTAALKQALTLMKGRFGQYVLLQLSFIGWYFIGAIALGIGLLWVIPYQNVAVASFYSTAREEKGLAML